MNARARYHLRLFEALDAQAEPSAVAVVPLLMEFLHPRSVVDVGCGLGTWLASLGTGRRSSSRMNKTLPRP